ncbi:hypothetical protein DLAC_10909 [Tieghemostelium lacteum]|uniref:tRNA pseudouridine(55) synthase n=1 Tax=Tieghemostelium lacteum TaxID=361077 RepID=A0A151Z2P1_TIELA|nr:hypothetical protein DLAC_10909 [Tieghemostelium lacteum]|eukprot:KYQ88225.1 hypothetical protein DLAC_10909 [Tieghemostelium lacteum]
MFKLNHQSIFIYCITDLFKKNLKSKFLTFPNEGIVPIYKEAGMTSANCINILKYHMSTNKNVKLGHAGTLDADAQGVLVSGGNRKSYSVMAVFGYETDTLDSPGHIVGEFKEYRHLTKQIINERLQVMLGEMVQIPPVYSAIKVNGKSLSEMAIKNRVNEETSTKPQGRLVSLYSAHCKWYCERSGIAEIELEVSSGFYVRSLVRDMALQLNSTAYSSQITRTKAGPFTLEHSLKLKQINQNSLFATIASSKTLFENYEFDSKPSQKVR